MFLASKPAVLLLFLNSSRSWFSPTVRATIEYCYYYSLGCPSSHSTGRTVLVAARSRSDHSFLFTIAFVDRGTKKRWKHETFEARWKHERKSKASRNITSPTEAFRLRNYCYVTASNCVNFHGKQAFPRIKRLKSCFEARTFIVYRFSLESRRHSSER